MAGKMPADFAFGFFPSAQRLSRGGQPGVKPKRVQETVERLTLQVLPIQFHGVVERATRQEPHVF